MDTKYKYIVEDLKNGNYGHNVACLFKEAGADLPPINKNDSRDECAKAFLIWLAISTFGVSIYSDMILCHMGLLKGYSQIVGLQERRKKLFKESDYHFSGKGETGRQMTDEELSKKARQFNHNDNKLLEEMIDFFDVLYDKASCYIEACECYLAITRNSHKFRQARLPEPSFVHTFDNPIRFNLRFKNPLFSGREDILKRIEENLNVAQARKVVVLYGMGGVGKTQVALEYAYIHQDQYSTIVWLDATSFNSLDKSCRDFLMENTKYNDRTTFSDPDTTRALFKKFISRRTSSLIILDNTDYIDRNDRTVQSAHEKLLSYIPSGNVHIIITTHNKRVFQNAPMIQVDVFSLTLATEYLSKKTGLETDSFASILAERLGQLPLALDCAGGYISTNKITYKEYLELWDSYGFKLFDQPRATLSDNTIRQTFTVTMEKLKSTSLPYYVIREFLRAIAFFSRDLLPIHPFISFINERNKRDKKIIYEMIEHHKLALYYIRNVREANAAGVMEGYLYASWVDQIKMSRAYIRYVGELMDDNPVLVDDPLVMVLNDKIKLNELLSLLSEYSIINREEDRITIHPMLRELIMDETPEDDKAYWYFVDYYTDDIASVYRAYGDKALTDKYTKKANDEGIERNKI